MALQTYEIPKYYTTPYRKVGVLNAASAGALGADTNGVSIHTFTNDGLLHSVQISSDDTAAVNVFLYLKTGSTYIPLGIINVPASSGNSGSVGSVDGLAGSGVSIVGGWIEMNGKRVEFVPAGYELKCAVLANMTSGKKCHVTVGILERA
jgi:hypothetical protein